jgi:hypothetical protein
MRNLKFRSERKQASPKLSKCYVDGDTSFLSDIAERVVSGSGPWAASTANTLRWWLFDSEHERDEFVENYHVN